MPDSAIVRGTSSDGPIAAPSTTYRAARAAMVVGALITSGVSAWSCRFIQDDAYISFIYARNLVLHHQLVYNLGEYVEGYTNFLWVLMVAVGMALGLRAGDVAQGLGILFFLGSTGLLFYIIEAGFPDRPRDRVTDLLPLSMVFMLPLLHSAAAYATGGMATSLFGFLTLASVAVLLYAPRFAGWVLFALCLTRPEGPLLWVLLLGVRWLQVGLRTTLREHVAPMGALAVYLGWKLYYFGNLLPNTFYAKSAHTPYFSRGFDYVVSFYLSYPFALVYLILPLLVFVWRRNLVLLLLWAFHVSFVAYVMWVGGGFMEYKPLMHAYPAGVAAIGLSAAALHRQPLATWFAGMCIAFGITNHSVVDRSINVLPLEVLSDVTKSWADLGRSLKTLLPSDTVIACTGAGALPFFSELENVDPLGLTEPEVARMPLVRRGVIGHERMASQAYLKKRGVHLMIDLHRVRAAGRLEPIKGDELYIRVGPDRWMYAKRLRQNPGLLQHMRRYPKKFIVGPHKNPRNRALKVEKP